MLLSAQAMDGGGGIGPGDLDLAGPGPAAMPAPPAPAVTAEAPSPAAAAADPPPRLILRAPVQAEGSAGTTSFSLFSFPITLDRAVDWEVTAEWETVDGSAKAGLDYIAGRDTVRFEANQTSQTIVVEVIGDTAVEEHEFFFVRLLSATGADIGIDQAQATIQNDDWPVLAIADVSQEEGADGTTVFTFSVTRTPSVPWEVTADWATGDDSARAGEDYIQAGGGLSFPPNSTAPQMIAVEVVGDGVLEDDETFFVSLSNADGGTLGRGVGTCTIRDDDGLVLRFDRRTPREWQDQDGDRVRLAITGGGYGEVILPKDGQGDAFRIRTYGTTLKDRLTLTVRKAGGGAGRTSVGGLLIDGSLGKLSGKAVDLAGDLTVEGLLASLILADASGGHEVRINAGSPGSDVGKTRLAMTLGRVADLMVDTGGMAIGRIKALCWVGGGIQADSLASLIITGRKGSAKAEAVDGDFAADVILRGQAVRQDKLALGSVKVARDLAGSTWKTTGAVGRLTVGRTAADVSFWSSGRIGALTLGAADGSEFIAGADPQLAGVRAAADVARGDFVDLLASIGSVTIKGWPIAKGAPIPAFLTASYFVAPSLGTVRLLNGDQPFKVRALAVGGDPAIGSITHKDRRAAADPDRNWTWKPTRPMPVGGDAAIEAVP